ncbi:hypothetical protein D3C80_1570780 [compost metagenome]
MHSALRPFYNSVLPCPAHHFYNMHSPGCNTQHHWPCVLLQLLHNAPQHYGTDVRRKTVSLHSSRGPLFHPVPSLSPNPAPAVQLLSLSSSFLFKIGFINTNQVTGFIYCSLSLLLPPFRTIQGHFTFCDQCYCFLYLLFCNAPKTQLLCYIFFAEAADRQGQFIAQV